MVRHDPGQQLAIGDVAAVEDPPRDERLRTAQQRVEDDRGVTGRLQRGGRHRSDVAGAAGDQDLHPRVASSHTRAPSRVPERHRAAQAAVEASSEISEDSRRSPIHLATGSESPPTGETSKRKTTWGLGIVVALTSDGMQRGEHRRLKPVRRGPSTHPTVSLIIPTLNEADNLRHVLPTLPERRGRAGDRGRRLHRRDGRRGPRAASGRHHRAGSAARQGRRPPVRLRRRPRRHPGDDGRRRVDGSERHRHLRRRAARRRRRGQGLPLHAGRRQQRPDPAADVRQLHADPGGAGHLRWSLLRSLLRLHGLLAVRAPGLRPGCPRLRGGDVPERPRPGRRSAHRRGRLVREPADPR